MPDWLKAAWQDNVWSKVIAGLIIAAVTGVIGFISNRKFHWIARFRTPALRKTDAYPSDQSAEPDIQFPLKYYLEVVNDSRKCVAVRVVAFTPNAISLQKFVTGTLQVMFDKWCPRPLATAEVALLPHQRCRVWIGVDATKFKKEDLDRLEGKIGTLVLTANGKRIPFDL